MTLDKTQGDPSVCHPCEDRLAKQTREWFGFRPVDWQLTLCYQGSKGGYQVNE